MIRNKFVLILIILLMGTGFAFSQNKTSPDGVKIPGKYKIAVKKGRSIIAELMTKQKIPGLSIAVSINNNFVWSEGFGLADLANHVLVTPQTRFRIGSLSKLFTATAISKLYEQGLLDIDSPVQKYVPTFPRKDFDITTRELVGHLAGIRHYKQNDYINQHHYENVSLSLNNFENDALLFQPNSKYFYSSYGFVLLSAVIEGASRQDYLNYMQSQIFSPIGLRNTLADDNVKIIENKTQFYSKSPEGIINNEVYMDTSDRLGAGGFLSTANDLVQFGNTNLNDSFFRPETRNLIFTSQKTVDGKETNVGFGWRLGRDIKGRKIYHHGGDTVGGHAFLIIYPEHKLVIAMACNLTFAQFAQADAEKIANLFIDKTVS